MSNTEELLELVRGNYAGAVMPAVAVVAAEFLGKLDPATRVEDTMFHPEEIVFTLCGAMDGQGEDVVRVLWNGTEVVVTAELSKVVEYKGMEEVCRAVTEAGY